MPALAEGCQTGGDAIVFGGCLKLGKGWAEARLMTCCDDISHNPTDKCIVRYFRYSCPGLMSLFQTYSPLLENWQTTFRYTGIDIERYNYLKFHIVPVIAISLDTSITHPDFASKQCQYITLVSIHGLRMMVT